MSLIKLNYYIIVYQYPQNIMDSASLTKIHTLSSRQKKIQMDKTLSVECIYEQHVLAGDRKV